MSSKIDRRMRQTELVSVLQSLETTLGLNNVVMIVNHCTERVTIRLDSSPVLEQEVPYHIRHLNVAIVVPRMARRRHGLGDASREKFVNV